MLYQEKSGNPALLILELRSSDFSRKFVGQKIQIPTAVWCGRAL
jgi:hypothetical protein